MLFGFRTTWRQNFNNFSRCATTSQSVTFEFKRLRTDKAAVSRKMFVVSMVPFRHYLELIRHSHSLFWCTSSFVWHLIPTRGCPSPLSCMIRTRLSNRNSTTTLPNRHKDMKKSCCFPQPWPFTFLIGCYFDRLTVLLSSAARLTRHDQERYRPCIARSALL